MSCDNRVLRDSSQDTGRVDPFKLAAQPRINKDPHLAQAPACSDVDKGSTQNDQLVSSTAAHTFCLRLPSPHVPARPL